MDQIRKLKEAKKPKSDPARADFKTTVAPLFAKYCTSCHGGDNPKNDMSLEFSDERDVAQKMLKDRKVFERAAERIRLGEMPPGKRAKPNEAETGCSLLTWIRPRRFYRNRYGAGPRDPGNVAHCSAA